jgi:hypothetical protein
VPSIAYTRWVHRVWDRLADRTGRTVFYMDCEHIAAYCPACGEGTILLRWLEYPEPGFAATCSRGCGDEQIGEALFG